MVNNNFAADLTKELAIVRALLAKGQPVLTEETLKRAEQEQKEGRQ